MCIYTYEIIKISIHTNYTMKKWPKMIGFRISFFLHIKFRIFPDKKNKSNLSNSSWGVQKQFKT